MPILHIAGCEAAFGTLAQSDSPTRRREEAPPEREQRPVAPLAGFAYRPRTHRSGATGLGNTSGAAVTVLAAASSS